MGKKLYSYNLTEYEFSGDFIQFCHAFVLFSESEIYTKRIFFLCCQYSLPEFYIEYVCDGH